ncbi:MAG: single-stranded-DNA-specific exonuclease RecJ [Ruminococcaceae bacterium]|nr:single-stranded-DNA-specific exonuclease RecJ [Oscillospiraceae bacterium]
MSNTNESIRSTEKKWELRSERTVEDPDIKNIAEKLGISPLTALLVYNRGQKTPEKAAAFISAASENYYDPFCMPDMEKAVERILRAIENKEKTVIYGDYDVDGVTSVSILYMYLCELGLSPEYYIPSRSTEGYGVNNEAIKQFAEKNITLMITVDTGVTALEEVKFAQELGIDVVITDHHECLAELPEATAVVNPRRDDSEYPFCELAGVGVVYKLLCAIEKRLVGNSDKVKKYIDLVAIGTVADVMPLIDENRLLVTQGLEMLNTAPRTGIASLLKASSQNDKKSKAGQKITSSLVSFTIAPRINAAGRIESAEKAVQLFLGNSVSDADTMAEELCEINRRRQAEENRIIDEAAQKIKDSFDFENDRVIVLAEENWHHGVIGIVASRITERFAIPSILISFDENNIGKGSGRSVKGVNLVDALTYCSDLLIKYGGHELAAGLTVDREHFEAFKARINQFVRENVSEKSPSIVIEADAYISPNDVSLTQANELLLLEPYGVANPSPVFFMDSLTVRDVVSLADKHSKLILEKDGVQLTALYFGHSRASLPIYKGDVIDIAFTMGINEFRGVTDVQIILKDLKRQKNADRFEINEESKKKYQSVMAGVPYPRSDDGILPSREDFAQVYLYLKRRPGQYRDDCLGMREIINASGGKINYCKLRIILDVLEETGLINITYSPECDENFHFGVNFVKNKIDIEKSSLYVKIRSLAEKQ